jgi:hypothetical protein
MLHAVVEIVQYMHDFCAIKRATPSARLTTAEDSVASPPRSRRRARKFLKLGGAPSQHLLIGGAITGWSHSSGGATETMANLTGSLYVYPRARSGFFFTGGLGLSGYHVNTVPAWDGTGWGLTLGAGYDIRVGRDVSLTPVVNYLYGAVGDVTVPGTGVVGSRWRQDVIDVGLGVTFH